MLKKGKVVAIAMLISVVLATAPLMFLAHGQLQSAPAEQVVALAERASQHVQALIDMVEADEDALDKIGAAGLSEEWADNVALFSTGLEYLEDAKESLVGSDDRGAVGSAVDALKVFRDVYRAFHILLVDAGIQKGDLIEKQGLLEAIVRELQRIDKLREILSDNVAEDILGLLDSAYGLLNDGKRLLLEGDAAGARAKYIEAKENIAEVYQYLKSEAEESNEWRLRVYCEGLQERIRERFRQGREQGIDLTRVLQSYGYQSENQYMTALQNSIQRAQSGQDLGEVVRNCRQISQMVQQMDQALNQEIGRHQGQNGSGPGGSGNRP